jgi:O-methyltransferase involved in polyketide biosynthesis
MRQARCEAMIAKAAAAGEPWLSFFVPDELESALSAIGFSEIEDQSPRSAPVASNYLERWITVVPVVSG